MTHPSEVEARKRNQTAGHRKQNGKLGNARTPAGGYTLNQLMGAIGIMLMSGIVNTKKRTSLHWSLSPNYNFPRVRNCMKRDEFYLLYSRHLRPTEVPRARTTGCRVRYKVPHTVSIGQGRMGRFTSAHNLRYESQFRLLYRRLMCIFFAVYFYRCREESTKYSSCVLLPSTLTTVRS